MLKPGLFLDRDGVINLDKGYVSQIEDFDFLPGIFELVRAANLRGYLVVVVTNQAGIGRGLYTEEAFHSLTKWMIKSFSARSAIIEKVYYSPYHPEFGVGSYKRHSACRKPNPGMILQAAHELEIDLNRSVMVGDQMSDMLAGLRAGIPIRVLFSETTVVGTHATVTVKRLSDAIKFLDPHKNCSLRGGTVLADEISKP